MKEDYFTAAGMIRRHVKRVEASLQAIETLPTLSKPARRELMESAREALHAAELEAKMAIHAEDQSK